MGRPLLRGGAVLDLLCYHPRMSRPTVRSTFVNYEGPLLVRATVSVWIYCRQLVERLLIRA